MRLFAFVIFVSAFLLFQVQPMIAKVMLPWFGSTAGVWTACLMFFQTALLVGYTYAHGIVRTFNWKHQAGLHIGLLVASLLALPIMPGEFWKPTEAGDPTLRIVLMLVVCVGGPYMMLASTGPLLQRWFGKLHEGRSPYRLFALSNAGSLAGLLSYPFLFEPLLTLQVQTIFWSVAYGVFALSCGAVAFRLWRRAPQLNEIAAPSTSPEANTENAQAYAPVTARQILLWLALSACGSVMLLSTTNLMCQDIAAVPFLWVVPLSVYLLTFIIAFDSPRWYWRPFFLPAVMLGIAGLLWVAIDPDGVARFLKEAFGISQAVVALVTVISLGLFTVCMGCHGELARAKPDPSRLTLYFLCVSAGGALGGVFVGILAPQLFLGYWEFPIALVLSVILIGVAAASKPGERNALAELFATLRNRKSGEAKSSRSQFWLFSVIAAWTIGVLVIIAVAPFTDPIVRDYFLRSGDGRQLVEVRRNFFGVWRTTEQFDVEDGASRPVGQRSLVHGRITHGYQFFTGNLRREKTSYYGERSGVGVAITRHPKGNPSNDTREERLPLRIGVIGLGTGTIAAYADKGDVMRFYEINPMMGETAESQFTFLGDARRAGADVEVYFGDARLMLEQQAKEGDFQRFDVLAVDAFSGDAIPVHLLTKECYDIYWQHLQPDGILAIHVSNKYLELDQVVRGLAETDGRRTLAVNFFDSDFSNDERYRLSGSEWMLVTSNEEFIKRMPPQKNGPAVLWTDDYSSLLSVLLDRSASAAAPANSNQQEEPTDDPPDEDKD